ncbi:Arginine N-methyltransferase 2 [Cordyceps fumosorosea ARSEF 2679]|uniref:Arginine N-methyltransferase 2 n=1 Tax=Cordyceps fumosorosea (strain ARSEF 2679) TaxID=1081104 RepID=A0A168E1F0_CORFA|nr:Arginine N-methyltransferase 2 [Cordyceps fumosorosea ARSEF 2679]OAA73266.1 Arginine N-methyltransferase 2 [Cordyceps fumosorosea ARSEF 2679]
MPDFNDALEARIPADSPDAIRQVLLHAWSRDLTTLKTLLERPGAASEQDTKTGETPLHAVVRGCGPAATAQPGGDEDEDDEEGEEDSEVAEARACIQELFFSGAIWNDVDDHNETPGCTALRLGHKSLYRMFVDAGVRAEMLFGLMGGYEQLSSGAADDEEDMEREADEQQQGEEAKEDEEATGGKEERESEVAEEDAPAKDTEEPTPAQFVAPDAGEKTVTSEDYLQSTITYDGDKLLDEDLNGVMMAWETDIMRRSVATLLPSPSSSSSPGPRILNIGFGMGIVDGLFADLHPSKHHIIEAHPGVLAHVTSGGHPRFNPAWEASGPEPGAFQVLPGRWQDVVPTLAERGELYDAIYFDTFGEDYAQLRDFFSDWVPALLNAEGRFGFFNGLGADRRVCYDVYARVFEMHAAEAGLDVEWQDVEVDMRGLGEDGKGAWEGVRRRYWTLDSK